MRQCPQCGRRFLADHVTVCDVDGSALQAIVITSAKDRLVGAVILDQFQIDGILGDGGMGVVYSARHQSNGRRYAIKVLRAEYSDEEDLVNRFQQEAESVRDIHHPNIIEVFHFGTLPDNSRFFVMELLEGRSLGQLLAAQPKRPGRDRRRALPEALTIRIAKQLCDGLAAAHARGIVHRDMKPDNVHLIRRGGDDNFVKILDFGIAKVHGSKSARTRTGSVFGTPHYMAPEQASGERDIDPRTDVYAVGVLMYEMATGKVPFDADNLMGILTAHLYHPPVPPRHHPEGMEMSEGLEAVILKALSKRRENRYATMLEMRDDLARVERGAVPLAIKDDDKTGLYHRPGSADDAPPPLGPVAGAERLTLPEGRIARGSGPQPVQAPPQPGYLSARDIPTVEVAQDEFEPAPALPVPTGRSIPPVTGSATHHRSVAPYAGRVGQVRSRGPLIAALAGTGAVSLLAAIVVAGMRHADGRAGAGALAQPNTVVAPERPAPPPQTVPSAAQPAAATPTSGAAQTQAQAEPLSNTITLVSDPPHAQVYLGRRRVGFTPFEAPRPTHGEVTYTLAADGRLRTPVVVRPSTSREVQVMLPPRVPASSSRAQGASAAPGQHGDLINPWATGTP